MLAVCNQSHTRTYLAESLAHDAEPLLEGHRRTLVVQPGNLLFHHRPKDILLVIFLLQKAAHQIVGKPRA